MTINIDIIKSSDPNKKFEAVIHKEDGKVKKVKFGAKGYSDMTQHKNEDRKMNYISRHRKNENWTASGYDTAGFLSRHILWNKSTLRDSIKDVNNKFKNLNVKLK